MKIVDASDSNKKTTNNNAMYSSKHRHILCQITSQSYQNKIKLKRKFRRSKFPFIFSCRRSFPDTGTAMDHNASDTKRPYRARCSRWPPARRFLPELEENVDNCSVKSNVSQKDGFKKIEQKHENEFFVIVF